MIDLVNPKELKRLEAVERFSNFTVNREKDLQDIVKLASYICNSPIALITLMGEEIQWIKAKVGADVNEMPRKTSFCTHAIEQEEVMVVDDALLDNRFSNLPVVTENPNIRFYASANLQTYDKYNVGTLCVFDVQPKSLTQAQKDILAILAKQVSHLMELDLSMKQLKERIDEVEQQKEQIDRKNQAFRKIAQIQSHELRLPVSSILGIMGLLKEIDYESPKEYLLLLNDAVNQLDNKIRTIVDHANHHEG